MHIYEATSLILIHISSRKTIKGTLFGGPKMVQLLLDLTKESKKPKKLKNWNIITNGQVENNPSADTY